MTIEQRAIIAALAEISKALPLLDGINHYSSDEKDMQAAKRCLITASAVLGLFAAIVIDAVVPVNSAGVPVYEPKEAAQ